MKTSNLSLKGLDVFQRVARSGSVQGAAREAGLSVSTVSHHVRALEAALDVALFDHARRPMRLTPAGAMFLDRVEAALALLKRAEAELRAGQMGETRALALAVVEDFDSEIAPELARMLAAAMPHCAFRHLTRPSHETLERLRGGEVDIGVAARPQHGADDLVEYPVLRDPFVIAVPLAEAARQDWLQGSAPLPLLRYARDQIIGQQIEAQLRRLRRELPNRYEFESNQTIMGMVAEGSGWAITTPTNYARAVAFQRQVALLPFPEKGFARYLSVFAREDHAAPAARMVARTLRGLVQRRAIDPAVARMPWLREAFTLMPDRAED